MRLIYLYKEYVEFNNNALGKGRINEINNGCPTVDSSPAWKWIEYDQVKLRELLQTTRGQSHYEYNSSPSTAHTPHTRATTPPYVYKLSFFWILVVL